MTPGTSTPTLVMGSSKSEADPRFPKSAAKPARTRARIAQRDHGEGKRQANRVDASPHADRRIADLGKRKRLGAQHQAWPATKVVVKRKKARAISRRINVVHCILFEPRSCWSRTRSSTSWIDWCSDEH